MKYVDDKLELIKGEAYNQPISGFDMVDISQIVVGLYKKNAKAKIIWVLEPDEKYPSAKEIYMNDDNLPTFLIETENLETGDYLCEVKVTYTGVKPPVLKDKYELFTLIDTAL